jgi:fucose 4-O-acetylase-like acetyltransferase
VFTNLFVHVRMPLFTFLSGFVYACRPLAAGHELAFLRKKLRRLGVPLIVATTLLYCLHLAMHHRVPPHMWTIYVFPYWHLWFVQALLVVFGVIVALESSAALATLPRFMLVFVASVALFVWAPFEFTNALGLNNATYLLPFFVCGLGAHRFRGALQSRRALIATAVAFVLAQGFHSYIVLSRTVLPIDPVAERSGWNLLIGMSAGLCALQLLPPVRLMERIGGSSYVIYLYHPLFVAAALFPMAARGSIPTSLVFVVACASGVLGPMLMEELAGHVAAGRLLLEGLPASARARPADLGDIRASRAPDTVSRGLPDTAKGWLRQRLGLDPG